MTNDKVNRLRMWVLVLTIIVVFGAISAPFIVSAIIGSASDRTQLQVGCQIIQSQNLQLSALREISDQLGVPTHFEIPELPPECREL